MKKNMVKNYRSLIYIQIGNEYIRKDAIRSIEDSGNGEVYLWAGYGTGWTVSGAKAKRILSELCFNEK